MGLSQMLLLLLHEAEWVLLCGCCELGFAGVRG